MTPSNYKMPLFLGLISTLVMPFLTFIFVGLFIVRLEIGLDLFSFFYTAFDLLYAFFFLVLFAGNLFLLKALLLRISFKNHTLKTFNFLVQSSFILFAFLTIATIFFSIEPISEAAYTFWLACFSIGILLNISIGIYLLIQAKSERKTVFLWIGFAFVFAQVFDYSGFRVFFSLTENITPDFIWEFLGLSFFDYESMASEIKTMFDEITSVSLFLTLSLGAVIVLVRTVALAIFYVLMAQLLFMRKKPKKILLNSNEEKTSLKMDS
jgi:hypothetical protein